MPTIFTCVFLALYVGHHVGDHWTQTGWQATTKHLRNCTGRRACFLHVVTLTFTKALFLAAVCLTLDVHVSPGWTAVALLVDGATHYWCDRRFTLLRLVTFLKKDGYWKFVTVVRSPGQDPADTGPGTGSFHLDQSWHLFWIGAASLAIAALS
jgi:hypothetical protein